MTYYKKNEMIFYRIDESNKSYLEVFDNGGSQSRIMEINDTTLYDQLTQRLVNQSFDVCTQQQFEDKLAQTKLRF